jgi:hypothetical protein
MSPYVIDGGGLLLVVLDLDHLRIGLIAPP